MPDEPMSFDDPRRPVRTAADLDTLDGDEIMEGYRDGYEGFPCSGNRSRAYWHGWRNGMVDSKRLDLDDDQRALVADYARANSPPPISIFVFGSNLAGRHGKGAALWARQHRGAIYGRGEGLQGNSYGIPTKDRGLRPLGLDQINVGVRTFLRFAAAHRERTFELTPIGCGYAGYKPEQIAPMFSAAPSNVFLPEAFLKALGRE